MSRHLILNVVTLCVSLAGTLGSLANPIVINGPERRPTILGGERLIIAVSADHATITGSFVFQTSQTDKSKNRVYSDFYKGYLCVPVYVPANMTNAAEITSLVAMTISCEDSPVETRIISGTPLVNDELQKTCPRELRIVWFAAKLREEFLVATHQRVSISYRQEHFRKDGKLTAIYTPMLPVTREVLKKSSDKDIHEYKAWFEIIVKPEAGVSVSPISAHSISPVIKDGIVRMCPVDLETLLLTVGKGRKAE